MARSKKPHQPTLNSLSKQDSSSLASEQQTTFARESERALPLLKVMESNELIPTHQVSVDHSDLNEQEILLAENHPSHLSLTPEEETVDEEKNDEFKLTPSKKTSAIEPLDPLTTYLRAIKRHPLLSAEETQQLATQWVKTGEPTIAARLITANLRLVIKIAYEYRRAYKNIMDLIQEGNIGLMQAVKRYDPYRGVKLSSYAAWWIRAYILRFILNNWRLVKLGTTQTQRKLFFNLRKTRSELMARGIDPTDAEVAKRLSVSENEVAEMDLRLAMSEKSLDVPVGNVEGRIISKIDTLISSEEGPETSLAEGEMQALLKEKFAEFRKTLGDREKELAIFDERLIADDPLTLQELGDRFHISRERVRQVEQRITKRLREYLRNELEDFAETG
ncbi:sigma-70 family RNA polymerase sigma factor [Pajaroellobacter abortibovis]|uniref:RNA polymerase sigma-70 domain-containing protein n=1 Tax=Pajaroellobacter abortibovis TaxID=1882918 RepID=A0A1L6MVE6_9BACT|nr:RNA polymerase factor sigma-32 [Pajaroellobacter abortibovis]APR99461.1 hypothetical protein BCY86_01265 [Pajaroellobacter abortibovis]